MRYEYVVHELESGKLRFVTNSETRAVDAIVADPSLTYYSRKKGEA